MQNTPKPLHHHNIVYPATSAEMQIRTSSTYWFFSQDADVDFKEGVESIELKVPLEDSEPVKT